MIRAVESVNESGIDLKLTSAVVEMRFLGKKPIGVFTERNGASLVDRFLSEYVSLHDPLDLRHKPTFAQCNALLESIEERAKEFNLVSAPIFGRTYDLIIAPEKSIILHQSIDGLNTLSKRYLDKILPLTFGYYINGSFADLRQAEITDSLMSISIPRPDTHGIIRNP